MRLTIPIGKTGRITEGESDVGRFVRVERDGSHFLVITSPKRVFTHGELAEEVWDNWVEDEATLNEYFAQAGWVIEWLD